MPDPSNNSFIPKRGPTTRSKHGSASRRVYVFTIVSYIILFATLLASGGVFFYSSYATQERNYKVAELDKAINSFSEAGMKEVLEFDARLQQAADRVNSSVSVLSIFKALEESTIDTVGIENLAVVRKADEEYALTASIRTDSFDSTIFQRDTYQGNQTISNVEISQVNADIARDEETATTQTKPVVTFTAILNIPVREILYDPAAYTAPSVMDEPVVPPVESVETVPAGDATTTEPVDVLESDNEETI